MNSECFSVSVLNGCSLILLFKTLLSPHISLQVDICLHSKQGERSELCISLCNMPFMCLFKGAEAVERIEERLCSAQALKEKARKGSAQAGNK